jgi:DNA-binding NarL/FixJ family response regulator
MHRWLRLNDVWRAYNRLNMGFDPQPKPRVVLVDDHPLVLAALDRMLRTSCDVVASVSSGREAIEAVGTFRPDVLVADLMMPDVDGLEVCRRVKRLAPETAVVIITASDDIAVRTAALRDGASAFVPKHLAAETLARTIERVFAEILKPPPQMPSANATPDPDFK